LIVNAAYRVMSTILRSFIDSLVLELLEDFVASSSPNLASVPAQIPLPTLLPKHGYDIVVPVDLYRFCEVHTRDKVTIGRILVLYIHVRM